MPIAIEVVAPERFAQWVAAKGGTMPGATPAAADSTAATVVTPAAGAPAPVAGAAAAPPTGAAPAAPGNTTPGVANRATDGTN
jgi:cytochrome c oxidase subunit 2